MNTILKYLNQPSTWRGLITVLAGFGVAISPELAEKIIAFGVAGFGIVEVVRDERNAKKSK